MKINIRRIVAGAVIAFAPVISVLVPSVAHAATNTVYEWTGASSGNWSDAGNWNVSTDGGSTFNPASTAPQSTDNGGAGDDLVFDASSLSAQANLTDDIQDLVVNSISSKGVNGGGFDYGISGSAFTLTSGLQTTPLDGEYLFFTNTVHLGASQTWDNSNVEFNAVDVPSGMTLTLKQSESSMFTGAGTINVAGHDDTTNAYVSFLQNSAFTGTLNIQKNGVLQLDSVSVDFSKDVPINVLDGGQIEFDGSDQNNGQNITATIPNTLHLTGNGGTATGQKKGAIIAGTLISQGTWAGTLGLTFSGDVTLDGDTGLASQFDSTTTFNFAKLSGVGHTLTVPARDSSNYGNSIVQLAGTTVIDGTKGQTSYVIPEAAATPGTPDTGFAFLKANPVLTMSASVVAFLTIAGIAYRMRATGVRR